MEEKPQNRFTFSNGLDNWFSRTGVSLAFTSYGSGELFLAGRGERGISIHFTRWNRPMGVCYSGGELILAGEMGIHFLPKSDASHGLYDAKFMPRRYQLTGDVDAHEIAVDKHNQILFAATSYSCVAAVDADYSFKPVYRPDFVSALVPEDRCHLNGLGLRDGELRYVSVVSRGSDVLNGWKSQREQGGGIIDIQHGSAICRGLSMPHSPRFYRDNLWYLNSGTGWLRDVCFCPGFLRGLAFHQNYAIVTVSLPRDGTFSGLALQDELERRRGEAWCAVLIINLDSGAIEEWIRIEGPTRELFDVCVLDDCACPMAVSAFDPQLKSMVTFPKQKERATLKAVQ